MIIELPLQLTNGLEQAHDQPLPLEVPSTNRRYLLVDADRYAVVPRSPSEESWSESKNARRCNLIRRKFAEVITPKEETD